MAEAAPALTPLRTETRIEWRFLADNGSPFQRYSRKLGKECWFYGIETSVDPEWTAGSYIQEPDGSSRKRKRYVWPLEFNEEDLPVAAALVERMSKFEPNFPPGELFSRLLLLAVQSNPLEAGLTEHEIGRIATAVKEALDG